MPSYDESTPAPIRRVARPEMERRPGPTPADRWPARSVLGDVPLPDHAEICVTAWPTRHLHSPMRWFDELYVWAEGFAPAPEQWSRIQLYALQRALVSLEREEAEHLAVTLSYPTVLNFDEQIDQLLQSHLLVAHRLNVLFRGSIEPVRAPYRIRAFVGYLRALQITVGVRVTAPRLAMELNAFTLVQPEFAKVLAPEGAPGGFWDALATEARFAGISERWLIVAGLQTADQVKRAIGAGIGFGQGSAVRPAHRPPLPRGGGAQPSLRDLIGLSS